MLHLFRSVIDRVKAMFTLDAALDLEQEFVTRQAERKAVLMRRADDFQSEGLTAIAADLRRQADNLSERRPLQSVFAFLDADDPAEQTRQVAALGLTDDGNRAISHVRPRIPNLPPPTNKQKGKNAHDHSQADSHVTKRVPQSRR